jgi:hypothetical protein
MIVGNLYLFIFNVSLSDTSFFRFPTLTSLENNKVRPLNALRLGYFSVLNRYSLTMIGLRDIATLKEKKRRSFEVLRSGLAIDPFSVEPSENDTSTV